MKKYLLHQKAYDKALSQKSTLGGLSKHFEHIARLTKQSGADQGETAIRWTTETEREEGGYEFEPVLVLRVIAAD